MTPHNRAEEWAQTVARLVSAPQRCEATSNKFQISESSETSLPLPHPHPTLSACQQIKLVPNCHSSKSVMLPIAGHPRYLVDHHQLCQLSNGSPFRRCNSPAWPRHLTVIRGRNPKQNKKCPQLALLHQHLQHQQVEWQHPCL